VKRESSIVNRQSSIVNRGVSYVFNFQQYCRFKDTEQLRKIKIKFFLAKNSNSNKSDA